MVPTLTGVHDRAPAQRHHRRRRCRDAVGANNKREIEAAGLGFILGNRIGHIPYVIDEWREHNPGAEVPDGLTLTQPWPRRTEQQPPRAGHLLPVQAPTGPAARLRGHRRAGRQGRTRGRGEGAGQAEPVHHPDRRRQEREPRTRGQGADAGRVEDLHHQHHEPDTGVRDRRLPPALAHREELPHVQARPASPTDLRSTNANRSRLTSRSCSPPSPSPTRSRPRPAGRSSASSRPPAATEPSPSAPATTSWPQKNHCPNDLRDALAQIT